MNAHVKERQIEAWLLDNVEEDFKVKVTMKPKYKKEDPSKYRQRLKRLNDMYLLGNISESEYKEKSAEIQRIIADLSREEPVRPNVFTKDWKDVYKMLDDEHRRSFWHGLIKGIRIDENANPVEILY